MRISVAVRLGCLSPEWTLARSLLEAISSRSNMSAIRQTKRLGGFGSNYKYAWQMRALDRSFLPFDISKFFLSGINLLSLLDMRKGISLI